MRLPLVLDIAVSLLRARRKQSLVAAAGVTFGIAAFITLISFMNGLNQMLDGLVLNRTPHVRIYNEIKPSAEQPIDKAEGTKDDANFISSIKPRDRKKQIYNSAAIIAALKSDARVLGVAPRTSTQVFFLSGTIELAGVVNGVDVEAEEKLFHLGDNVTEGNLMDLATRHNTIFIGKGIADKMMVTIGDVIQVTTPKGELTQLKIAGILQFGLADVDNTQTYVSLETVQKLLGETAGYITDIQVKLHDITLAPVLAKECAERFGVDAIDIQTANAQFETGSTVRSIISYAVGITLLIVAGFGIYNILNMMIYEKLDSIAILKATGFSGRDVKGIFISLSLIIGISGGIAGLLAGYTLSSIIDNIPFETEALPTIKTFPVYYNPLFYAIGIVFSIATTYIAGLFPARKAGNIDPVVIIRGK
jgi:lipoprotein-releasing system permease protein